MTSQSDMNREKCFRYHQNAFSAFVKAFFLGMTILTMFIWFKKFETAGDIWQLRYWYYFVVPSIILVLVLYLPFPSIEISKKRVDLIEDRWFGLSRRTDSFATHDIRKILFSPRRQGVTAVFLLKDGDVKSHGHFHRGPFQSFLNHTLADLNIPFEESEEDGDYVLILG